MEFLEHLERTFGSVESPTLNELKDRIQSLRSCLVQISQLATEPEQLPYGRNVVYRNEEVEIIVLHIPGYAQTSIHDHGPSIGCGIVAEGQLTDQTYRLDSEGYPVPVSRCKHGQGSIYEFPFGHIHELSNPHLNSVISLHVYSPPLTKVKRYIPYYEMIDFVI